MLKTKKFIFLFLYVLFCSALFAAQPLVTVYATGYDGERLEADTTLNPVMHIKIFSLTSDTLNSLTVKNTLDSWGNGSTASEDLSNGTLPDCFVQYGVRVWYIPSSITADTNVFDLSSAKYVTTLACAGNTWSNNILGGQTVQDGALWITVDVLAAPAFGTVQFQTAGLNFASVSGISNDEPAVPPVLSVIQNPAAKNLQVSNSSGNMQPEVSTDQDSIIATKLIFYNNSASNAAPISIGSIAFSVSGTTSIMDPSLEIADIKIQDADSGTTYGDLSAPSIPTGLVTFSVPVAIDVPPSATITANVVLKIVNAVPAVNTFQIVVTGPDSFTAYDALTQKGVTVTVTPFQLMSTYAVIRKKAVETDMTFDGTVIPPTINKGQPNVALAMLGFTNPGDASTANEEVYSIKISVKDGANNPVIPRNLFSRISVVNASGAPVTYGQKIGTAIENSGGTITIPLSYPIPLQPLGAPASVSIKADIALTSIYNDFRISIDSASFVQSRDRNSFSSIPVVFSVQPPLSSSLAILSSSFKASVAPLMPVNIYKGQAAIPAMNITLSSPLVYGDGNLIIKGITLTAKDASGTAEDASGLFTNITVDSAHWSGSYTVMPSSGSIYLSFPYALTLSSTNLTETISIKTSLLSLISAQSLQLQLAQSADVSCYQDNEPGRAIYIYTAQGRPFPLSSGISYVSTENSGTAFTSFPNPFRNGSSTKLAYYLSENSTVTISIYDITGSLVKEVAVKAAKTPGSHEEDTWDGKDKTGRSVLAGTYLAKIEVKNSGGTKQYSRKLTFIK